MPDGTNDPDEKVKDTREVFESLSQGWGANIKRTYDEFQEVSLTSARRSQTQFDQISAIVVQALQNAVVTQDQLAKANVIALQTGNTLNQQNAGPMTQETAQASVYPPNREVDTGGATSTTALNDVVAKLADALAAVIVTAVGGASTPSQTKPPTA